MTLSRTRIINTLIGLLILAVAALAAVPWLVPRIQEAARDEPDSDLVLAAVKKHQAVLDAEWTNPEASTGAAPPMQAELMIRDARKQLTQDGIPVTSATSEVKRIRPTYQGDGNVHVIAEVSTSKTYADVSSTNSVETNRHTLVLTGNDDRGYSVVSDEVVDPARPSPPMSIRHRADLMGLGVSIVFASIAVVAVVLSRRNRAHLPRGFSWLPFGGTFALKNAETSAAMVSDKSRNIESTGTEYVTGGDSSCLMNIAGSLSRQHVGIRAIHLAEILASTKEHPWTPTSAAYTKEAML